jgi:hypothetical protein
MRISGSASSLMPPLHELSIPAVLIAASIPLLRAGAAGAISMLDHPVSNYEVTTMLKKSHLPQKPLGVKNPT